jgi:hypothetical protein
MHTKSLPENPKGRDHSKDIVIDGMIILEMIFKMQDGKVWTECIRLRIGTSGGLL